MEQGANRDRHAILAAGVAASVCLCSVPFTSACPFSCRVADKCYCDLVLRGRLQRSERPREPIVAARCWPLSARLQKISEAPKHNLPPVRALTSRKYLNKAPVNAVRRDGRVVAACSRSISFGCACRSIKSPIVEISMGDIPGLCVGLKGTAEIVVGEEHFAPLQRGYACARLNPARLHRCSPVRGCRSRLSPDTRHGSALVPRSSRPHCQDDSANARSGSMIFGFALANVVY